ncbi:MAG: hypothetical protein V2I67_05350 [Thermoanaerobaculales bacterium]|nr:hypothetical protein [Thermoanaerobaculales bacterium]
MNMRTLTLALTISALAVLGCGGSPDEAPVVPETASAHDAMPNDAVHGMPADDVHAKAMGSMGGAMHGGGGGVNADIHLDPETAGDWSAVKIRLVELATMAESFHEVPVGGSAVLGDSGLTLLAEAFIPDFVMDENGITSRSAEPANPAARVVISEDGAADYTGWLFAAMPEIHPFPHETYGVVLVEGIPAESR